MNGKEKILLASISVHQWFENLRIEKEKHGQET